MLQRILTREKKVVDSYVQEAGSFIPMELLASVQAGRETYTYWWKQQQRKYRFEKLEQKYGPLVQKAIRSP